MDIDINSKSSCCSYLLIIFSSLADSLSYIRLVFKSKRLVSSIVPSVFFSGFIILDSFRFPCQRGKVTVDIFLWLSSYSCFSFSVMENFKNVPKHLYGLSESQMDMFMTEDSLIAKQSEKVTEVVFLYLKFLPVVDGKSIEGQKSEPFFHMRPAIHFICKELSRQWRNVESIRYEGWSF